MERDEAFAELTRRGYDVKNLEFRPGMPYRVLATIVSPIGSWFEIQAVSFELLLADLLVLPPHR